MATTAANHGKADNLTVVSAEPVPGTFEMLCESAAMNLTSATLLPRQVAFSSQCGTLPMHVKQVGAGTNTVNPLSGEVRSGGVEIDVETTTIDTELAKMEPKPLLIKVDVEGHDFEVIRGASGSLADGLVGFLQFEYNHRWLACHRSMLDVFDLVQPFPYQIGHLVPEGIELIPEWTPEVDRFFESNFALIREDFASHLGKQQRWTRWGTLARV